MKFTERNEWEYDPSVFKLHDVQTALKIHDENIRKHSPQPLPIFIEMDRSTDNIDHLWNVPVSRNQPVGRELPLHVVAEFESKQWQMTAHGLIPQQKCRFWVSNLELQEKDYFPQRGDYVIYRGTRYFITFSEIPAQNFWQQTGVWLGVVCHTIVPIEGDNVPVSNPSQVQPREYTRIDRSEPNV